MNHGLTMAPWTLLNRSYGYPLKRLYDIRQCKAFFVHCRKKHLENNLNLERMYPSAWNEYSSRMRPLKGARMMKFYDPAIKMSFKGSALFSE